MYSCMLKRFILGCICTLYLPGVLCAATSDSSWGFWLENQIEQHPEVLAAKEKMNAVISMAEGRERPLYNPEIETEYEREGENNNYRIGVNQTIDLWDKRTSREQQASFTKTAAQHVFTLVLQQKKAEALQALIAWQAASQQAELAQKQESQMDTLLNLVKERQLAGDLGQLDAELTYFSLSQRLKETAQTQAALRKTEMRLRELLPDWSPVMAQIPEDFWSARTIKQTPANQWQDKYPAVVAAKAEWQALQQAAELARRQAKADPTLGINAGESGEESVVGLTFSIPLHFRNNFSSEIQAASQEAASAKAQYRATRRKQHFAIAAAQAILQEYEQRFERWQNLMQGRGERSGQLLEKQWRSGDMSTTEYLLAMQQRSEGLIAGIELRTLFHSARTDWLLQTGQLNAALINLNNND